MKLILIYLFSIQCLSQEGIEVIYKYESNFKKEIPKDNLYGKVLLLAKKTLPNYDFVLTATNIKSKYGFNDRMSNDAFPEAIKSMVFGTANSDGVFYSNVDSNISIEERKAFGNLYKIISDFDDLSWEISDEQKMISGYQCKKATLEFNSGSKYNKAQNRNIVAWFAPKLNYPFGPIGYRGLPGLIIELNVNWNYAYRIKISSLKFLKEKPTINEPCEGKSISKEDFKVLGRKSVSGR